MFNYKSLLVSLAVASLSVEALPAAIKRIDQPTPASVSFVRMRTVDFRAHPPSRRQNGSLHA